MPYEYVNSLNRYRDAQTKRLVSRDEVMAYVMDLELLGADAGDNLGAMVASGEISPADFNLLLKQELKSSYIQQGILGRGGRDAMDFSDWGSIGNMLKPEYRLIDDFTRVLEDLSDADIRRRSRQYFGATRQAYEAMNAKAHGVRLPAYPADGSTLCVNGCKCNWRIEKLMGAGNLDCYWDIDLQADNCATCIDRNRHWAPIRVRNGILGDYKEIKAGRHHH